MDFVSFSMNYWDDLWQSRHQIASRLATRHKVLFVSPPFSVRDVFTKSRSRPLPKSGLVQRKRNLYTFVPPKWLFENHRFPWIDQAIADLRSLQIKKILSKLGFRDLVLLIWHPRYSNLVGRFGEKVSCYYVDEEFTGYYGVSEAEKESIRGQEDLLLRRVDLVFANGSALLERKNRYRNAMNVPMGVDFELFSRALLEETPLFEDLSVIPAPRIGYVGNVNDKVDFQLLEYLAAKRPQWSILLIGPDMIKTEMFRAHFAKLRARPNVFIMGSKRLELLPNYIKGLDVCLMCYRIDCWAYFGYPLKLHEYLASGKPVISSDLPSIREFSQVVRIAQGYEEWLRAIEECLRDQSADARQARVEVARQNTWEDRVRLIEEAIAKKMAEKGASRGS